MGKKTRIVLLAVTVVIAVFTFGMMWTVRPHANDSVLEAARERQTESLLSVSQPLETDPETISKEEEMAEKVAEILLSDDDFIAAIADKVVASVDINEYIPGITEEVYSRIASDYSSNLESDILALYDKYRDALASDMVDAVVNAYNALTVEAKSDVLSMDEIIHHLAVFVSRLWQIHVFGEGNTRTTAVFFIKYLRTLGFDVTNDIFAENAWYFRNSLVRANYNDLKNGVHETTEYLEMFLRNLLLNENNQLYNRTLHISGTFNEPEKPDIEALKPDIEALKPDIEKLFRPKTASQILRLREAFPGQTVFGRSDVMKVIDIKASRASDLLREMVEHGVTRPVSGHGKGKYQFRQH